MKAEPQLPTSSARAVAEIGVQAVAAAESRVRPGGASRVKVALVVGITASGLTQLVHADTGEPVGVCASPALAQRTRDFFA